jgi:nucleotide-binding universal stress UspA family protein
MSGMDFLKILVPVVGSAAALEAIHVACKLIDKKTKGMVSIVHVIAVDRTLPIDTELETEIQKAEGVLESMETVARESGCEAESELLQARDVGQAIVDEAAARKVDLILLGTAYKVRFGQFSLGEIVPYVLKYAPCHVMLFQYKSAAA